MSSFSPRHFFIFPLDLTKCQLFFIFLLSTFLYSKQAFTMRNNPAPNRFLVVCSAKSCLILKVFKFLFAFCGLGYLIYLTIR